eukprot:1147944-Alexandrium_andersonii.AAC.1
MSAPACDVARLRASGRADGPLPVGQRAHRHLRPPPELRPLRDGDVPPVSRMSRHPPVGDRRPDCEPSSIRLHSRVL